MTYANFQVPSHLSYLEKVCRQCIQKWSGLTLTNASAYALSRLLRSCKSTIKSGSYHFPFALRWFSQGQQGTPAALVERPLRGWLWFYSIHTTTLVLGIVSWTGPPKCNAHLQRTTVVLHLRQKWGGGPFLQLFHWGPEAPGLRSLTGNQLYLLWSTTHSQFIDAMPVLFVSRHKDPLHARTL